MTGRGRTGVRSGSQPARQRPRRGLAGWLLFLLVAQIVALEAIRRLFVDTARGQRLDTAALDGYSIGQGRMAGAVDAVLDGVTALSVVAAILTIGFIALMRGRVILAAVATAVVLGANFTTQLLKVFIERPELGVDLARAAAGNSLPSGHTTVTASVVVALVLVLPVSARAVAALLGAGAAALVGVATLSAGWHRPSDAVAAFLVVGAWAAAAGLALMVADRVAGPGGAVDSAAGAAANGWHRRATAVLLAAGVALLALAALALVVTNAGFEAPASTVAPVLGQRRQFVAYAGGAAGIAATACLTVAMVLLTAHRVVRPRS